MTCCSQCGAEVPEQGTCPRCGAEVAADEPVNPYVIGTQAQAKKRSDAASVLRATKICFWEKYLSFEGRTSLEEFRLSLTGVVYATFGFLIINILLDLLGKDTDVVMGLLAAPVVAYAFLPLLGLLTRRVHDVGFPGWSVVAVLLTSALGFSLQAFSAFDSFSQDAWLVSLGLVAVGVYFLTRPGQRGPNKYGPDPKERPPE